MKLIDKIYKRPSFGLLLFTLLLSQILFSQKKQDLISCNFVAQYKLIYKTDSTNNSYNKENFILMFNNKQSVFRSITEFVKDSLLENSNINKIDVLRKYKTKNSEFITYNVKENLFFISKKMFDVYLKYEEKPTINWQIVNEKRNINGVECRKATAKKYGREWVAWYSEEHVFPFGPYKFGGLPGLIFEISDKSNSYTFVLYKFKNENIEYKSDLFSKIKTVSKNQFIEIDDKIKYSNYLYKDISFDDPNIQKEIQLKQTFNRLKNNNPLELKPE